MKSRDSMVLYRSFYDAIKELPEKNQLEILKQIFDFGLDGIESELTGLSKTIWILIKPNLEANRTKWESGCKAKRKQNRSKAEANVDVDDNVNEDKDENENENEKLNIKPNGKKKKEKVEFVAPSYEEVKAYYIEEGASLHNLDKCFAYYTDGKWLNRDGKKVKDWKRTIKTNWLSKTSPHNSTNVNRDNSQPQVDPAKIINYGKGNGAVVYSEKYNVYYEPIQNGQPPKEVTDLIYLDQGNHGHYGEYVKWMLMNDRQPMPPDDTRYFPADFNFEKFISEQKAILANSNQ